LLYEYCDLTPVLFQHVSLSSQLDYNLSYRKVLYNNLATLCDLFQLECRKSNVKCECLSFSIFFFCGIICNVSVASESRCSSLSSVPLRLVSALFFLILNIFEHNRKLTFHRQHSKRRR